MNQERLAIPKATADEVPPGLTNSGLKRHFGIGYYQVKLWVFHTGYQVNVESMRGRPVMEIPSVPLADMPEGLCHYEVANKLGVPVALANKWAVAVGYNLIDGRSKHCVGQGQKKAEEYRAALEAGAGKTLAEMGKELGLTRERVRQLHVQLKIPRENNPHSHWKQADLVNKVKELATTAKSISSIEKAVGLSKRSVAKILNVHNIPFKNWVQKRLEQEIATGIRECTICHASKPLTDYFKQHDGRLGKMECCKDCVNLAHRKYRERKGVPVRLDKKEYWEKLRQERNQMNEIPTKRCTRCGHDKPLTEYHRNRTRVDGHMGACKPCQNQIVEESKKRTGYVRPERRKPDIDDSMLHEIAKEWEGEKLRPKTYPGTPKPKLTKMPIGPSAFGLTAEQINKLKEGKV